MRMIYNRHLIAVLICLLSVNSPNAQSTSNQNTVAVLDFEGRGIYVLEAATLSDRFTSELGKTNAMRLKTTLNVVQKTCLKPFSKAHEVGRARCARARCGRAHELRALAKRP